MTKKEQILNVLKARVRLSIMETPDGNKYNVLSHDEMKLLIEVLEEETPNGPVN